MYILKRIGPNSENITITVPIVLLFRKLLKIRDILLRVFVIRSTIFYLLIVDGSTKCYQGYCNPANSSSVWSKPFAGSYFCMLGHSRLGASLGNRAFQRRGCLSFALVLMLLVETWLHTDLLLSVILGGIYYPTIIPWFDRVKVHLFFFFFDFFS